VDLKAAQARAFDLKRPLVLLVAEFGQSQADEEARALLESPAIKSETNRAVTVSIDIGVSRNRAEVARFHVMETPLLLCLTSRGIIVSRDERPITRILVSRRIDEALRRAPELDAKLLSLETAAGENNHDVLAQFALTDFLLAHQNALEAIPRLATLARAEASDPASRVRAWVALARARLWILEPEKGRHEAEELIATLGPATPEARAGGELVLGAQDANAKRANLARREFEAAIAAAPESPYGKEAAEALARLPATGN
jgi:hypothetical protein